MAKSVKADLSKDPMGRVGDAIRALKSRPKVIHTGGTLFLGINYVKKQVIGGNPKKRTAQQRKLLRDYKDEAYSVYQANKRRLQRKSKV